MKTMNSTSSSTQAWSIPEAISAISSSLNTQWSLMNLTKTMKFSGMKKWLKINTRKNTAGCSILKPSQKSKSTHNLWMKLVTSLATIHFLLKIINKSSSLSNPSGLDLWTIVSKAQTSLKTFNIFATLIKLVLIKIQNQILIQKTIQITKSVLGEKSPFRVSPTQKPPKMPIPAAKILMQSIFSIYLPFRSPIKAMLKMNQT